MKTIPLAVAAAIAMSGMAGAASAQPWDGGYEGRYYDAPQASYRLSTPYVDGLDWKIVRAARQGRISWPEARELRAEVRSVHDSAWRVQTGEANRWEVARLDRVVTRVERAIGGRGYGQWRDGDQGWYDDDED